MTPHSARGRIISVVEGSDNLHGSLQEIIESWRSPFEGSVGNQSGVIVYELSLVESLVSVGSPYFPVPTVIEQL